MVTRSRTRSGSAAADFDMSDLGQIFTQLGEMFSGAGNAMAGGQASGPVNYDLARQLASSSIGFVAPVPEQTSTAIADAVRLAETWLDGATAAARRDHQGGGVDTHATGSTTRWTPGSGCATRWPSRSRRCGPRRCPRRPRRWPGRCCR